MKKNIFLLFFFYNLINGDFSEIKTSLYLAQINKFAEHLLDELKGDKESVEDWYNRAKVLNPEIAAPTPIISNHKFIKYLFKFIKQQTAFLKSAEWLSGEINMEDQVLFDGEYMQPFVLKYQTVGDTRIFIRGDSHGDIQALVRYFAKLRIEGIINDDFTIKEPKSLFFFLGDLTDRGQHGPDTLALLFIFATKNPQQVFLVRGNHEDLAIISRYGFLAQMEDFFKIFVNPVDNSEPEKNINTITYLIVKFFNLLPSAVFIGCNNNYFQFCHGGFEPRYNPQKLLSDHRKMCFEFIRNLKLPDSIRNNLKNLNVSEENFNEWGKPFSASQHIKPDQLGFLWYDFNAPQNYSTDTSHSFYNVGRGLCMGLNLVKEILNSYSTNTAKVKGIIRAHQHNDSMPGLFIYKNTGVYSLWGYKVLTTVGTSLYENAPAFLRLTMNNNFEYWQLTSFNFYDNSWHSKTDLLINWKNEQDNNELIE